MAIKLNRKGVGLSGANLDKENQNLDLIEQEFKRVGDAVPVAEDAKKTAVAAEQKATAAVAKADNVESQLHQVVVQGDSSPQAAAASVGVDGTVYPSLKARIDAEQGKTNQQLVEKVTKDAPGVIPWAMLAQDARENISGGKTAVVGPDSVINPTIANRAVSYEKTDFADEISLRAKNLMLNGTFVDADGNGTADGWNTSSANITLPRVVNNAQVWLPLTNTASAEVYSLSTIWGESAIAGHKYFISFRQTNVGIFRINTPEAVLQNVAVDGKYAMVYTPSVSGAFNVRFRPRVANVETSVQDLVVVNLTKTFGAGKEPESAYFEALLQNLGISGGFNGMVNLTDVRKSAVLTARDVKLYDPEGIINGANVNEALANLSATVGTGTDLAATHATSLAKLENDRLSEEVNLLKSNARGIYNLKMNKPSDKVQIPLKKTTRQKLILHLHKRANDGYDTKNDVYLPNAEKDFSDIKITNEDGAVLPYRITYQADDFDILVDSRLGYGATASYIVKNSAGKLIRSFDCIKESNDGGKTWSEIAALREFFEPRINLMTENDTLLFSSGGYVYRSEKPYTSYTQVYDLGPSGDTGRAHISGKAMVQHPDGEIFFGIYQSQWHIRFCKSSDDGRTWELSADFGAAYQHVHGMYVDVYANPVAVYAGADGGGGLYRTTDKGKTWVDLRALNPNMPQATDYGVTYADPSGYRLMGGETPVVGGHSIVKTNDDVNFRPVLSSGISVNYIAKKNGKLFATGSGSNANDVGAVMVSEDDGETWQTAYLTAPITASSSVNDGYREMTELPDQLLIGPQSSVVPYLRIFLEGHYAEIVVDVPAGSSAVIVESGYAYTNVQPLYNDTITANVPLVHFNLNEGGRVIRESVSGNYFEGDFAWRKAGKHLSYFYPYLSAPGEKLSVAMKSLKGYTIDSTAFDASGGITISFWAMMDAQVEVELFRTDRGDVFRLIPSSAGFRTELNGAYKSQIARNVIPGALNKIDLAIDALGEATVYNNGLLIEPRKYNSKDVLDAITNSSNMTLLETLKSEDPYCMQHFSIRKGVIAAEQSMAEYHSHISNNLF